MFPEIVRKGTWKTTDLSINAAKKAYTFSRSTLWIVGTSFVILALPVLFEVERVQTEEAALMQQRQVNLLRVVEISFHCFSCVLVYDSISYIRWVIFYFLPWENDIMFEENNYLYLLLMLFTVPYMFLQSLHEILRISNSFIYCVLIMLLFTLFSDGFNFKHKRLFENFLHWGISLNCVC